MRAKEEAAARAREARSAQQELDRRSGEFSRQLSSQRVSAERREREQLRRQAQHLATASAEAAVRERTERAQAIDEVRQCKYVGEGYGLERAQILGLRVFMLMLFFC